MRSGSISFEEETKTKLGDARKPDHATETLLAVNVDDYGNPASIELVIRRTDQQDNARH